MRARLVAYWRLHSVSILLLLACLGFYYVFAFLLQREDTIRLLSLYAALFFICFKLIQFEKWNLRFLLAAGLLFRLVFLFEWPNLSQDFYRFIWDGRLILAGINPYLHTPDELMSLADPAVSSLTELYNGMGSLSARNFSNYPPLNQLFFALAAFIGGKGITGPILAMRLIIITADLGVLYFGRKLLLKLNRSPHLIFWYFLNPLVIIELTGNLHFEGVMLFFFIWSLYLAIGMRWGWAAIVYACSVALKLIPLIFLPLFITHFGFRRSIKFFLLIALAILLISLPFAVPGVAGNYGSTLGLWFSNFEFNAGLYNLVKKTAVLFDSKPWELIKAYGKIIPFLTIALVLVFTFFRNNRQPQILLGSMMWVLSCYYLLSPTVHPWYVITLVLLCIYTDFRFPLFWSAVVVLSYSAYANPDYQENLWLLAVEYFVVIGMMLYEIIRIRGDFFSIRKN